MTTRQSYTCESCKQDITPDNSSNHGCPVFKVYDVRANQMVDMVFCDTCALDRGYCPVCGRHYTGREWMNWMYGQPMCFVCERERGMV